MANHEPKHPNSVLLPFMAPGHIIPMIDMAKLLAKRGVDVTIIVTHLDAARFSSVIHRAVESGLSIRLLKIRFPCEEAGLPPGCESIELLPSYNLVPNFFAATNMLQKPLEKMLIEIAPTPSCIICDKHLSWTAETCNKFQIPRIIFDGMSCFTQLVTHNIYLSKIHQTVPPNEPFVVPGLPDRIEFTRLQLPGLFNPGPTDLIDVREQVMKTELQAYGVVINSFEEVENRYVDEFRKLKNGRVWCVGPLSRYSSGDLGIRGGIQASIDYDQCLKWLDERERGSVVYACLGSLGRLSPPQFMELALGLEASHHPFILVMQGGERLVEVERWISDEGIEERCRERGLFVRGWAPQVLILSHPGVGAFLTHCGWNSTLEGISAGLPMITWPIFADQFLNEKLVVQVLETGVRVGARGIVYLGEEEKPEINVTRDEVKEAVRRVMDEREDGCERKERARKLGEMAKRSVEEGGSEALAQRGPVSRYMARVASTNGATFRLPLLAGRLRQRRVL
ncbi:hypothetical protein C2S53_013844 [Perilla frutescens var. hirtella]|uniref:Glycosyltransferase n=1 Tax=Perilla frutescens var. hirtella TaxID=608512 RepID=A0AAD4NWV1_PERFH|nr:hypothetical protein C2S53_013844 [Perilla frutescens var. hirtella]